jgi:hypothetical protein
VRRLDSRGWIGFEESVRANVRAFILSEVMVGWLLGLFSWYGYFCFYLWISSRLGNCLEEVVSDHD